MNDLGHHRQGLDRARPHARRQQEIGEVHRSPIGRCRQCSVQTADDETIRVLKSAVKNAKLGHGEEMQAFKRLDEQARALERTASGPSFEAIVAGERDRSPALGGRSVVGWEKNLSERKRRSAG